MMAILWMIIVAQIVALVYVLWVFDRTTGELREPQEKVWRALYAERARLRRERNSLLELHVKAQIIAMDQRQREYELKDAAKQLQLEALWR